MSKTTIRVISYAKKKNVHPAQIRHWVRKGLLPAIVIGRTILLDEEECDRVLSLFQHPSTTYSRQPPFPEPEAGDWKPIQRKPLVIGWDPEFY
jgi:hypothetical protein